MARRLWRWLAALVITANTVQTHAATVTLTDFPDPLFTNAVIHGFRISPSCHSHGIDPSFLSSITGVTSYPYGGALSWDGAGCGMPGISNADYLGTDPGIFNSYVHIDAFDQPFNFLSFDFVGFALSAGIFSSKGGFIDLSEEGCFLGACFQVRHRDLSGGNWNGVRWVLLGLNDPGASALFFDNLRFHIGAVPAPGTIYLLLIGVGILGAIRGARQLGVMRVRHNGSWKCAAPANH